MSNGNGSDNSDKLNELLQRKVMDQMVNHTVQQMMGGVGPPNFGGFGGMPGQSVQPGYFQQMPPGMGGLPVGGSLTPAGLPPGGMYVSMDQAVQAPARSSGKKPLSEVDCYRCKKKGHYASGLP